MISSHQSAKAFKASPPKRPCWLYQLGLVDYQKAWDWQRQLVRDRIHNPQLPDTLLLLEHPPVYTLGQGASLDFLKFNPDQSDYALHRIERGGEVTYHCPGQLVGYPILNLKHHQPDLHWYLRQLEEVIIRTLSIYDLKAERIPGLTGVWLDQCKVAAIGIKVSRWITMHGFSLNINPDLSGFDQIVPCGIQNRAVGSLGQFIPNLDSTEVTATLLHQFSQVFDLDLRLEGPAPFTSHAPSPG
ncbi:lipoyl(octanoyl) transferase LipB [Acaryochloris sp. IP29b_bin.137]|uniref:lipoyl(octanoyl) transferase LipB n=1 Tax=Acaryochloris sp. IP29b_bin.137 TaxID=2969217 RepID=UPI00261E50D6|nr:lipoyl(octanoyl) transferase LipB [Acaryochloris sp. IP29b_bin.137]